MKEAGTAHWVNPNIGADNSSGFLGVPGVSVIIPDHSATWDSRDIYGLPVGRALVVRMLHG